MPHVYECLEETPGWPGRVREESQLGTLPDGGDILRCLVHEVTYPEFFFTGRVLPGGK